MRVMVVLVVVLRAGRPVALRPHHGELPAGDPALFIIPA
jgi:hypothetical protein